MSTAWTIALLVGLATIGIKAMGPVILGGRQLPSRVASGVALLAPSLLAALVAVNTFGKGEHLVADARVVGVGAAAVAIRLRAPVLVVVVVAAVVTAVTRAIGG
jgi:branched-subunit amino acid transport protein